MSLLEWVRKNRPNDLKVWNYGTAEKRNDKKNKIIRVKKKLSRNKKGF